MRFLIGIPLIVAIISIVLNFILAGLLALTYTTLTQEKVIATIKFEKISDSNNKSYTAILYDGSGKKIDNYLIKGDQWQIDAGFYKLEYWANIIGMESKYTLDRFKGRYKNILDENKLKPISYQIEDNKIVDTFSFFIDTNYGSSTYKDIKLNTLFIVLKTPTGLMVREEHIEKTKKTNYYNKFKSTLGL